MAELGALLFDLDGTLVDTAEANYRAYAAALTEQGHTVGRARFDAVATGRRWSDFLPLVAPDADHAAIARRKRDLYPDFLTYARPNGPLIALARGALGLKLGLVTSASRAGVKAVLASCLTELRFDVIVTGEDVAAAKPSPEPYLLAARRIDVAPAACLVFEDSDIGAESAGRAGMPVLRVTV